MSPTTQSTLDRRPTPSADEDRPTAVGHSQLLRRGIVVVGPLVVFAVAVCAIAAVKR